MATKEIIKVNYDVSAYGEGPIGVVESVGEGDLVPKSIQVVNANHRAFSVPGVDPKLGSFIDGTSFKLLGLGFGNEQHPAEGIDLLFISLRKFWVISELKADGGKGDWVENQPWTEANAGLYKLLKGKRHVSLTYKFLVKLPNDPIPRFFSLKGMSRQTAIELNSFFSDRYLTENKRPSFSYIMTLKTKVEPTNHGSKVYVPIIHAFRDAPEKDFLECLKLYQESKKFYEASDAQGDDLDEPLSANVSTPATDIIKQVFSEDVMIQDDEISV